MRSSASRDIPLNALRYRNRKVGLLSASAAAAPLYRLSNRHRRHRRISFLVSSVQHSSQTWRPLHMPRRRRPCRLLTRPRCRSQARSERRRWTSTCRPESAERAPSSLSPRSTPCGRRRSHQRPARARRTHGRRRSMRRHMSAAAWSARRQAGKSAAGGRRMQREEGMMLRRRRPALWEVRHLRRRVGRAARRSWRMMRMMIRRRWRWKMRSRGRRSRSRRKLD